MKVRLEQRSFETGLSQVAIINAALEYYLAHVPVNDEDSEKAGTKPENETRS